MSEDPRLPFDPIERAGELWVERIGSPTAMRLATSIMRVQQLIISELDAAVKPFGITFARYEVLVLLSFSSTGRLPLSKIGARLMVHPTSVTKKNLKTIDTSLKLLPIKLSKLGNAASSGSEFNFFLCHVQGSITLPEIKVGPQVLVPETKLDLTGDKGLTVGGARCDQPGYSR